MIINCSKCGKDVSEAGAFGSDGFVCFDHPNCKPRTRTEYVKVTESIFDLKEEFERGELYVLPLTHNAFEYEKIKSETSLAFAVVNERIYRKVETPITEREEFIERGIAECYVDGVGTDNLKTVFGGMFDAGCRFK